MRPTPDSDKIKPFVPAVRAANSDVAGQIDILFTKIAVDLQNLTDADKQQRIQENLHLVCEASKVDAAALVLLEAGKDVVERVTQAALLSSPVQLDRLRGQSLSQASWISARLAHLRILEIANMDDPPSYMTADTAFLKPCGIASILLIGLKVNQDTAGFLALCSATPREWQTEIHLMLKLVGSSLASGLQRIETTRRIADERIRNQLVRYSSNDGLWDFNLQTNNMYFSPRWKRMLGYDEIDFEDQPPDWRSLVHADDLARVQAAMRDHMNGKSDVFESIHRLRHRNGSWRWVLSRAKALIDDNGRVQRLVGVELDITERKLYEDALFQEKERAQITLESIGDGVITTDIDGVIDYINPTAELLTGWSASDVIGRSVSEVFVTYHKDNHAPLGEPVTEAIRRKRSIASRVPMMFVRKDGAVRDDGSQLYVNSTAAPIRDGKGRICGAVLVFQDVSDSQEHKRQQDFNTSHDLLTRLLNRAKFEIFVEEAIKKAKSDGAEYAVVFLDLDQFRIINDSFGYSAGDELLIAVAKQLSASVRFHHKVARLGGDEFAILIDQSDLEQTLEFAEKLRLAIEKFDFMVDDRRIKVTTSVGVIPITRETRDVGSVMTAVDSACAAAKESGRNRVHYFQANDIELMRRQRELQWAARINHALEEDRFELFRQMIRPLQGPESGEHYELLLRMRDERGGMVAPDMFIGAAERYALMPKIDRWVIRTAFRWLLSEADARERLSMCAINLSGQSLGDDKFLAFVVESFKETGIDPTKICFEITETAAVSSFSHANNFIREVKKLGCKFSLDDFGTGLSSFSYLKHFPVDYLKIDGSFVKGILLDPIDREMVRSINEIGHLTGKKTIAEFAENDEIIERLREIGIDYAQGYGIAEPRRLIQAVTP